MTAKTIEEVILQLEQIISDSKESNSRIGYFTALYHKVTVRVRDGILKKEFEDNERMERFDVIFANRYLDAVRQWQNKQTPSGPWQEAFAASKKSSTLVLQHLLLGMNAHINFDLGIAAVEASGSRDMHEIRKDFNSINDILGSLTFDVLTEINRISPLLSLMGLHAANPSILVQFSIGNARDGAWAFAEELNTKSGEEKAKCIALRENSIQKLAVSLRTTKGLIAITKWFIWLFEWKSPRKIIRALNEFEKKYIRTT